MQLMPAYRKDTSESVEEHAKRNVLLWELSEVDSYSAQLDSDGHGTCVYDKNGRGPYPVDETKTVEIGRG